MIGLLHGYLLEGSGSNLWTRSVVRALCREGETVHLFCQENHPERYDFIAEAWRYAADGSRQKLLGRETPYPGRCVMHRPEIGETLSRVVAQRQIETSNIVESANNQEREEAISKTANSLLSRMVSVFGEVLKRRA